MTSAGWLRPEETAGLRNAMVTNEQMAAIDAASIAGRPDGILGCTGGEPRGVPPPESPSLASG